MKIKKDHLHSKAILGLAVELLIWRNTVYDNHALQCISAPIIACLKHTFHSFWETTLLSLAPIIHLIFLVLSNLTCCKQLYILRKLPQRPRAYATASAAKIPQALNIGLNFRALHWQLWCLHMRWNSRAGSMKGFRSMCMTSNYGVQVFHRS